MFEVSIADLFAVCELLPPEDQLHVARLRYWARFLDSAPDILWRSLLRVTEEQGWLHHLGLSFAWLLKCSPLAIQVSENIADWLTFTKLHPAWTSLVKKAARACLHYRHRAAQWQIWNKAMTLQLGRFGAPVPQTDLATPAQYACSLCDLPCFALVEP